MLLNLFFVFFWVFATFLADSLWGDSVSRGMEWVLIFSVVVGHCLLLPFAIERIETSSAEQ